MLIQRAGSLNVSTLSYLFGSVLTASRADVAAMAAMAVVTVLAIALTWRALFAVVFDEQAARVDGLPVAFLHYGLAVLTAVTVVAAMRVVGLLLVSALMVLPVGAAQRLTASFRTMLFVGSVIGAMSAVLGLAGARLFDLAPGGAIALVAAAVFALAHTVSGVTRRRA